MTQRETSDLIRRVAAITQQPLQQAQPMRPVPPSNDRDVDLYYWRGSVAVPEARGGYKPVDDQLFKVPTQTEASGDDAQLPLWATGNCPPWNCPPFWAQSFCERYEACIPTWEQEYTMGILRVPENVMYVIKSISYEVTSGLAQYDLFEISTYISQSKRASIEDMIIDPIAANPSERYAFSGFREPLPLQDRVDRNKWLRVTFRARGLVNLAGGSNHFPGEPINPNAHAKVLVEGWIAPLRRNVDGGPRPTDLGNMGHIPMNRDAY